MGQDPRDKDLDQEEDEETVPHPQRKLHLKRSKMKIDDAYPIWKPSMIIWLVAGCISLTVAVLILANTHQNSIEGTLVALASCLGLFSLSFFGFIAQVIARVRFRKNIIGCRNFVHMKPTSAPIVFAAEGVHDPNLQSFVDGLLKSLLIITIERSFYYMRNPITISADAWQPLTCVVFKPRGKVLRVFRGVVQRCRGLQSGNTCEIEWEGNAERALSLVRHELAHVALSATYPYTSEADQHRLMSKAGIS